MSDLLPPSSTATERALAEALGRLGDLPVPIQNVWNADNIPLALLPWLAWAYSVDEWDSSWGEAQKRATVKAALSVQRKKGTIGAVRDALGALGLNVAVQEWFNQSPPGNPYTFKIFIEAGQEGISRDAYGRVEEVIAAAKNLRSHFSEVVLSVRAEARPYVAAATLIGNDITAPNFMRPEDFFFTQTETDLDASINVAWPNSLRSI